MFRYPGISIPYLINDKINKVIDNSCIIAVPSIFFPLSPLSHTMFGLRS